MKLGIAGLLGDASPERVRAIKDWGFDAASWHLPDESFLADAGALGDVRDTLHQEDVELAQLLPPDYPSLVHPDPAVRAAGVDLMRRVVDAAAVLGAESVYVRPGSLNPAGPWTPHPENHRPETRERLVGSLREITEHASGAGVPLALEAHVLSPVDSAATAQEVLGAVGSPLLRFNADPVNLVGSIDQAYDTTSLVEDLFDRLGPVVVAAHAKDVRVEEGFVLHIAETVPGQGHLDYETFLRRFEECCPRGVVLIEHIPEERVREARRALLEFAARAGLWFEGA